MRIPRIFTDQSLASGASLTLEGTAAHHLSKVLRMQPGRELILFDGSGGEYTATIAKVEKRTVAVTLGEFRDTDNESPLRTELAMGISRGERMDWAMQKATELGVSRIQPLFTERTEVKLSGHRLEKRLQHWRQVIISACEQCQRNRLPELAPPLSLQEALASPRAEIQYVLHHRTEAQLRNTAQPKSVCLLIGPEGGLSDGEIMQAEKAGFQPLALGPRVLRTETAPVAALAVLQFHWGDF